MKSEIRGFLVHLALRMNDSSEIKVFMETPECSGT